MIVDTSAIVALVRGEPGRDEIHAALGASRLTRMSAASYVEMGAVLDRDSNTTRRRRIDTVLDDYRIAVEPVTAEQARIARKAYLDYGRGSGHPARLNLGDVFAYALAKTTREPLLFVGDDFSQTDVTSVLPR
jgi:ribonuclease VapC